MTSGRGPIPQPAAAAAAPKSSPASEIRRVPHWPPAGPAADVGAVRALAACENGAILFPLSAPTQTRGGAARPAGPPGGRLAYLDRA